MFSNYGGSASLFIALYKPIVKPLHLITLTKHDS